MKKYDVIIIGAGPAGIAAAKTFDKSGISFCIIDKNKFPRQKLCGGGLTNKSINMLKKLNLDINPIQNKPCKNVIIENKSTKKELELDNSIVMIDRIDFDNAILKQITGDIFLEENIIDINDNTLSTNKDTYEFKYIIFADGVNGYSRKFIQNRRFGFCVEYESDKLTDKVILNFNAINGGYGWIFPKESHTTIGLGNFDTNKCDYINLICEFAKKHNFEIDKTKIKGYHIPLYSRDIYEKSVINNKLLVGDAASLVDPISGEGIYYAMASGMYAAQSIIQVLKDNSSLKNVYFEKTQGLSNSLDKRLKASKLLYSKMGNALIKIGLNDNKILNQLKRVFG